MSARSSTRACDAILNPALSFDEEAWMREVERGVPEDRLEAVRARARPRAAKLRQERAEAWRGPAELGLTEADLGACLVLDGWHWCFMGSAFPAVARLLGEAPPEHAIREPRRAWLQRMFSRRSHDDLEESRLAAQPAFELTDAIEAAKQIDGDAIVRWLETDPMLNRAAPGEPIDPSMFREHIVERWQRLLALADELRDRDRGYLSGSG